MKKSKQLIGMGIVELESGKIIGKISSTVFFPGRKKIFGFLVGSGKWINKKRALLTDSIINIGKDKIIVRDDSILVDYEKYPEFMDALKEKERIFKLSVITNTGDELGYIEDIIIDEEKYFIEGYVLTDGITEDIIRGKTIIPFEEEMIFGEDTIIISNSYKNVILKNDISLKKVFKRGRRLKF